MTSAKRRIFNGETTRLHLADSARQRGDEAKRRLIRFLAVVAGSAVVFLGVSAAVIPDIVIATGRHLVSPSGLFAAAGFRAGVGLLLILAARASRAPGILHAIGAVLLVGAVATPLFGVEAARTRLDWEAAHATFFRVEGLAFVCLGGLIVSALRPGASIGR